jgi:aryl-alcohol dehydrogenase-like predicted oxidoreductase
LAEGCTLAQLALQFTLAHPAVSTVIPGIKNVAQARANIEAGLLDLAVDGIDAVVPPGGGRKIWPA